MKYSYLFFRSVNDKTKDEYKQNGHASGIRHIEDVDYEKNLVFLKDKKTQSLRSANIENFIQAVVNGEGCVSNPSAIADYSNFDENIKSTATDIDEDLYNKLSFPFRLFSKEDFIKFVESHKITKYQNDNDLMKQIGIKLVPFKNPKAEKEAWSTMVDEYIDADYFLVELQKKLKETGNYITGNNKEGYIVVWRAMEGN